MPASTEVQPKLEEDETALETVEDVPVNKMTSFNGRLQQFLHNGTATREALSTSRTTISQRRINTTNERQADPITPQPKTQENSATNSASNHSHTSTHHPFKINPNGNVSISKQTQAHSNPTNPAHAPNSGSSSYRIPPPRHNPPEPDPPTRRREPGNNDRRNGLPALYSVGNTNIVERPTRDASMLSRAEMDAGVPVLEAKVAAQRPEVVCLVGKSIWEAVWRVRHGRGIRKEEFRYGWQAETENMGRGDGWPGAPVFVATTTSGLAAGMKPAEKEAVWAELGSWVVKRRQERGLDSVVVKEEV
ncbi:hypothetical protein N7505_012149 [Penicillium chrysogenum]|uniref:Uracil-DNA glycosylase-like domain-containing protein n=1 Tax=Penicillium chrysogenum TaxID=5076 RepID=A0ABQ8W2A1_PENCH|nr:hypothetical protein N7505_012149 [Penicillium chrysogenum]